MARFECFSPEVLEFLRALTANNTKDWFTANKSTYETYVKEPAKQFAVDMALALRDLTGQEHSSKIFRIHRDVRFSKDKTPYNAHLHLAFIPNGKMRQPPMWFFGLSPERLSLGCGVFQYDKETLATFRASMAGPIGAELIRLTAELRGSGVRISAPELKRVPAGFDRNHRHEEVLRRKGFVAWIDLDDPAFVVEADLIERTTAVFGPLVAVFMLLCKIKETNKIWR